MLLSMDSAVSALAQFQNALNVTANNIANVNTIGFKSASVNFEDAFSQTLGIGGPNGTSQIGSGVTTASIKNQFKEGSQTTTNNATDLAINTPNGFFLVKDPASTGSYATRAGNFSVDANGYLTTSTGQRVQGYSDAALSTIGDIKIDNTGATITNPTTGVTTPDTAEVASYAFGNDGILKVTLTDGNTFTRGQILLQNFTSPEQLQKVGGNLYANLSGAGPGTPAPPGTNGLGSIHAGTLEMSNVDLASELTSLITTQRAYEANSKVVTTSDDILQTLVNLKRG